MHRTVAFAVRVSRLPLRGQRRPCGVCTPRTGFPFHPLGARPAGHLNPATVAAAPVAGNPPPAGGRRPRAGSRRMPAAREGTENQQVTHVFPTNHKQIIDDNNPGALLSAGSTCIADACTPPAQGLWGAMHRDGRHRTQCSARDVTGKPVRAIRPSGFSLGEIHPQCRNSMKSASRGGGAPR